MPAPSPDERILFGPTPFPKWVTEFRTEQWSAIEQVHDAFEDHDVVFLQAPTGTGKSLIGDTVRRLTHSRAVYTCTTKALQDQFVRDFPYARVLKGRSNYLTESGLLDQFGNPGRGSWSSITCADCTFNSDTASCRWCYDRNQCPYILAQTAAKFAELAVLNTSYLLTDLNRGQGNFGRNRELIIIDEADQLESEMLSHVEVEISPSRQDKMGIDPPKYKTAEAKNNDWVEWCINHATPQIGRYLDTLTLPWSSHATSHDIQEYRATTQLLERMDGLAKGLKAGNWVYDGYDRDQIIFRPIFVHDYGEDLLWSHAPKFLCMSATILSADMMADELGLTRPHAFVDVPSTFPAKNRPIFVSGVANMAYKNKEAAWPDMARGVSGVLARHPADRVLVHTVSYELARYLHSNLTGVPDRNVVLYTNSRDKAEALASYSRHPGSVLLAASMDRGVDLPDDLCRVQIVAKIPFPNISDKRINARMYSDGGMAWYRMQTIRTLIQMTGRGVRSKEDHAHTYILDEQFLSNLWKDKYLFPEYWKQALNFRLSPKVILDAAK